MTAYSNGATDHRAEIESSAIDLRVGFAVIALAAFWAVFSFYVVHTYAPPNPIALPGEPRSELIIREMFPQGWAFFTKSPRDAQFDLLRPTSHGWVRAFAGPESELRNAVGLSRFPRAQGSELGTLAHQLAGLRPVACTRAPTECLRSVQHFTRVHNPNAYPVLCGRYAITWQEPIPWSWVSRFKNINMPSQIYAVDIQCG